MSIFSHQEFTVLKKKNEKSAPVGQLNLCIVGECSAHLWGMSPSERLYKQFSKHGFTNIITVDEAAAMTDQVIFVRGDTVIDAPLISVLASGKEMVLTLEESDGGRPVAVCTKGSAASQVAALFASELDLNELAIPVSAPSQLGAAYWRELRKK